jgi:hypothetical protein
MIIYELRFEILPIELNPPSAGNCYSASAFVTTLLNLVPSLYSSGGSSSGASS